MGKSTELTKTSAYAEAFVQHFASPASSTSFITSRTDFISSESGAIFLPSPYNVIDNVLIEQGMRMREISDCLGYLSPNNFSDTFKRQCDMTPSEYKRVFASEISRNIKITRL